jgi:hypothetical protein
MQIAPILADVDWVWLVVLVIWGIIQVVANAGKKAKKADPQQAAEAEQRAREIQEEIRRRIAERQAQEQGQTQPAQQGGRPTQYPAQQRQEPPPLRPQPQPTPTPFAQQRGPARNRIEEMIRRVEEARRQQEEAQKRARQAYQEIEQEGPTHRLPEAVAAAEPPMRSYQRPSSPARDNLLAALSTRGNLRNAVLLAEVLGRPKGDQ